MSALLLISLLVGSVPDSVFENARPFKSDGTDNELTLSTRDIDGSVFHEYRVTTVTALTVEQLCDAVFEWGTRGTDSPGVSLSKVLRDGENERVVYHQISQPIVAKRDYAMTVTRTRDAKTCSIRFRATNEHAPSTPDGFVRMDKLWGSWRFVPLEGGKTSLTYTLFADPAGSIPAFLVHGGQKSSAKESVRLALAKSAKDAAGETKK